MVTEFLKIRIKEIMQKRKLPIVERTTPIADVLPFPMGRSHAWVIENKRNKKVVGVITEHDILNILSPRKVPYTFGLPDMRVLHKGTAEDIMIRGVIKCSPEETIEDALDKMTRHGMRRCPVTDENDIIVGEIHMKHIINKFSEITKRKR